MEMNIELDYQRAIRYNNGYDKVSTIILITTFVLRTVGSALISKDNLFHIYLSMDVDRCSESVVKENVEIKYFG